MADSEQHQAAYDGRRIDDHEGKRLQLRPDRYQLLALHGRGQKNAAAIPAKTDCTKGQEHDQVQCRSAGNPGDKRSQHAHAPVFQSDYRRTGRVRCRFLLEQKRALRGSDGASGQRDQAPARSA